MKGSGPLVATVVVASTVALTSSSSAGVQHVSFSPTSSNQESQDSASRNRTASEREKFAPRFDGLRFIETLVTAHR
ncbi:ATP synthase subunit delta', mitochondrial-like [Gossypium australe]|uniref:ATP synthase subunit delta', mitochondrial-like n=1 Tax=Gossypium australe TaxID=47621 RepID=A0A5B6UPI8_9ROSI|nr:ATP synthase subunit delta', mitochondrial-like [Gossypium australe]